MVKGAWTGTSMMAKSDSVTNQWSSISDNRTDVATVVDGAKDTVGYTMTYAADSLMAVSSLMPASSVKNAPMVTNHVVGRMVDGKIVGTNTLELVSKPDSVVGRGRWVATRKP